MSHLCAACGKDVGLQYVHDTLKDLIYCSDHSHLGSSEAKECQKCGQRVARAYYSADSCPKCGTNFKEARQFRYQESLLPMMERLKNVGATKFILSNLLTCTITGSIFFLVIHFLGRLITPVGAATTLAIITILPLKHEMGDFGKFSILSKVLDLFSRLSIDRIKESLVGSKYDGDNKLSNVLDNAFFMARRFDDVSTFIRLLLLIMSTLFVELFWPGFIHNLLIVAIIAIPSSLLDSLFFHRIVSPAIMDSIKKANG